MTAQITIQTDRSVSKNNHTEDVVSILETQLSAFRSIYDITARMRDKFAQSDANVLKNGIQERRVHLEHAHNLELQLRELKREWEATSPDSRVGALVDECQKVINKIVDLDMAMHRDASHQQRTIKAELSESRQRRQPIATYLATPAISASYSVPVAGRSVARNA